MSTSFFNTTTNLWSDAFLAGRRVGIWTTMTRATTTTKTTTTMTVNKDNNEDPNGKDNSKDNNNLIFDTTTNLWLDVGCIPGREGG